MSAFKTRSNSFVIRIFLLRLFFILNKSSLLCQFGGIFYIVYGSLILTNDIK